MEKQSGEPAPVYGRGFTIALVLVLSALTGVSQFYRNSIGVVATTLAGEFSLSPDQLGWLASGFFLAFALTQVPVGVIIDRFGPRFSMAGSTVFMVAGGLLFAYGSHFQELMLARVLLALGCSTFFVAPLIIYSRIFPPSLFSTLTGFQLGLGSIGTLVATGPLAFATQHYGWRMAFLVMVLVGLVVACASVFIVNDIREAGPLPDRRETFGDAIRGVMAATAIPDFWALFWMQFCSYAVVAVILGLWGGPFLSHVYGASVEEQGLAMTLVALAYILVVLAAGSIDRVFRSYKRPVAGSALVVIVLLLALAALASHLSPWQAVVFLMVICFFLAASPILMAHGKALFPPEMSGRGIALLNIGTMGGAFAAQTVTGMIIRAISGPVTVYPLVAYQAVFVTIALFLAVALARYWTTADPWHQLRN